MRTNILCFALGVWLLQTRPELPDAGWTVVAVTAAAAAGWLACRVGGAGHVAAAALVKAGCLAAGFCWAALFAQARLADELPAAMEGRDVEIVGVVASLPQAYERSIRFEFAVEQVLTKDATVPERITLSWWAGSARRGVAEALPELRAGERWRFVARLKRPHGMANPHGFDYEAWLLERGVRATGYVRGSARAERLSPFVLRPAYVVERARDALRDRIRSALGDRPCAGVIIALAVGDQRAIPPEQWRTFTRTGVNHLMSISGLHVTMVAGLAFALVGAAWRRSARLSLALPAPKAAAAAGLMAGLLYALLAGFAVPAQRTLYMIAVVALAVWAGLGSSASAVLCAALLAVLLIDPWAVLAPGFWLSFGAVGIILYVAAGRLGEPGVIAAWARVQWAVTLAMIPMLLALFQQVSVVSPIANAIAIPAVSLIVAPLALAGMMLPFDGVLLAAHDVMAWCLYALEKMADLPDGVWEQHAPPAWSVAVALLGAAWLLLPRGVPARWLGCAGFLPLFLVTPPALPQGALTLTLLDVGQGLAVVAQTRQHALLFDTGPAFGPSADSGNRVIVPFLRGSGVRRLDALVLSHDDIDHTGGALSVMQALPVARMYTSLPDMDPLPLQVDDAARCLPGQRWEWDGVTFEILHPPRASYDDPGIRDNDRSCVMKITSSGGSVLIAADVERRGETELLTAHRDRLRSEVLIVPHQGSRTSSSEDFVAAVGPKLTLFPVGYRNRFGHPHPDVVARYERAGSRVERTDWHGALTVDLRAGAAPAIARHRDSHRRYWHDAPARRAGPLDAAFDETAR